MRIFKIFICIIFFIFFAYLGFGQTESQMRIDSGILHQIKFEYASSDSICWLILKSKSNSYSKISAYSLLGINAIDQYDIPLAKKYLKLAQSLQNVNINKYSTCFLINYLKAKIFYALDQPDFGRPALKILYELVSTNHATPYFEFLYYSLEGKYLYYESAYDSAILSFEKAKILAQKIRSTELEAIVCLDVIYAGAYSGLYHKAGENLEKAKLLLTKSSTQNDLIYVNLLYAEGYLLKVRGRTTDAIKLWNKAINISNKYVSPIMKKFTLDIYSELAQLHIDNNEFTTAQMILGKAMQIHANNFPDDFGLLINLQNTTANLYFLRSDFSNDKNDFETALSHYKISKGLALKGAPLQIPSINYSIAMAMVQIRPLQEIKKQLEITIESYERYLPNKEYDRINTYAYYGDILYKLGYKSRGLNYFKKAQDLILSRYGNKHSTLVYINNHKAWFQSQEKKYNNAARYLHKALMADLAFFNDTNYLSYPTQNLELTNVRAIKILIDKAIYLQLAAEQLNDTTLFYAAVENYQAAINVMEALRNRYILSDEKVLITQRTVDAAGYAAAICYHLFEQTGNISIKEKAFALAEKCKASVLNAQMQGVKAREMSGIPASLIKKERFIANSINVFNDGIYQLKSSGIQSTLVKEYQDSLFYYLNKHRELLGYFEANFPLFRNMLDDKNTVKIEDIQKLIEKDQAVVEYLFVEKEMLVIVISKDNYNLHIKPFNDSIFKQVAIVRNYLEKYDPISGSAISTTEFTSASVSLYSYLFDDIKKEVKGKSLIIIPDRELNLIPFEVLLTSAPQRADMQSYPWLIKEHAISYAYAASLLKGKNYGKAKGMLAMAPTYKIEVTKDGEQEELIHRGGQYLKNLEGARAEVEAISKLYGGMTLEDRSATETAFLNNMSHFEILHLAMHTIINNENPMFSKLIFAKDTLGKTDGFLNTYELYNYQIDANLAVLSACNTGNGKILKGEGVMSLARGFIYAGVPNLVLTLWSISDIAGKDLMVQFYKALKKGKRLDIALQESKLEYLKHAENDKIHPYYWAGFISVGNPLYFETKKNWINYMVVTVLVFFAGWFVIKKLRTSKQKK